MPFSQATQQGKPQGQSEGNAVTTLKALLPSPAGHGAGEPRTRQAADNPEGEEGSCQAWGRKEGRVYAVCAPHVVLGTENEPKACP